MARREGGAKQHMRLRIAQEAARLLAETGGDDFGWARSKAAARLGVRDESLLPDGADAPIRIHLHADDPDAVARRVLERGIPARQSSRRVRLERDRRTDVPAWTFDAGGMAFEILQLPLAALRQAPRDPLGDERLARSSLASLRRRLEDGPPA